MVLERPAEGCLSALGADGRVLQRGAVGNDQLLLVEAADGSCSSWYKPEEVVRASMSSHAPPSPPQQKQRRRQRRRQRRSGQRAQYRDGKK